MSDEPREENQQAEDLPVVEIPTYPIGDESAFHTKNDPQNPYQRSTILQRTGKVIVRCEHRDVIHGYHSTDNDDCYSLIVIKFRFDPNGSASRIKKANATITFASAVQGKPDPVVVDMYPNGSFFVEPTREFESTTVGVGANLGGGVAGLEIGGELTREKTMDREKVYFTRVTGSIQLLRDFGEDNAVSWNFFENESDKSGVVSSLQGAILLRRESMDPFKATVNLDITADTVSRISSAFRKDPKDDDVLYDPGKKPTNKLRKYDVDNLGLIDLKSLSDVTFRTLMRDAVKEI